MKSLALRRIGGTVFGILIAIFVSSELQAACYMISAVSAPSTAVQSAVQSGVRDARDAASRSTRSQCGPKQPAARHKATRHKAKPSGKPG